MVEKLDGPGFPGGSLISQGQLKRDACEDDQHKEAELGELKALMSDDYFRAGGLEWPKSNSSEA